MPVFRVFCRPRDVSSFPRGLTVEERYAAFTVVSGSERDIEPLRKRFPLERLAEPAPPPSDPRTADHAGSDVGMDRAGRRHLVISLFQPVTEHRLQEVRHTGATFVEPLERTSWVVSSPSPEVEERLRGLSSVQSVVPYEPAVQLSADFLTGLQNAADPHALLTAALANLPPPGAAAPPAPDRGVVPGMLRASFFSKDDCVAAMSSLNAAGVRVMEESGDTRFVVDLLSAAKPVDAFLAVRSQPGLRALEQERVIVPYNDVARTLIGKEVVAPAPPGGVEWAGDGEVVAVADTGLDTGDPETVHEDFRGRVKHLESYPIAPRFAAQVTNPGGDDGPADRYSGHGTHVAGSVLGSGASAIALKLNPIRGMATKAKLVFQKIEQTPYWTANYVINYVASKGRLPPHKGLLGLPADLKKLFQAAYDQGARVHSDSWGDDSGGVYDQKCVDLDEFVWNHRDFLVVVAAGNSGRHGNSKTKHIDPQSVGSPAVAKNCLAVGACENDRGGQFSKTYGAFWPGDFPRPPFDTDGLVDSVDHVAAFSSRGPCKDGRRKPDVVAPGTYVLSARSSHVPRYEVGWGLHGAAPKHYVYMGGTSMATPLVAGGAALVRQFLRQDKKIASPSAALLKAAVIHAARYVPYAYANPASDRWADNEQGWGRVEFRSVLQPAAPTVVLFFDEGKALKTGDLVAHVVEVDDDSVPLRATLVYSDYPADTKAATQLVNNLNLFVCDPSGAIHVGNDFKSTGTPDSLNNVEGVVISKPAKGKWSVEVRATDVKRDDQSFALVISGGSLKSLSVDFQGGTV